MNTRHCGPQELAKESAFSERKVRCPARICALNLNARRTQNPSVWVFVTFLALTLVPYWSFSTPPPEPCVPTSCGVSSYSTNCSGGSISLTNATVTPTNGCVGSAFSASVSQNATNGQQVITPNCIDDCGNPCTVGCPPPQTNAISPNVVSNWWVVSGVGATPVSGTGTSASFTPTNRGTGTITFYAKWQNGCSTNLQTSSANKTFQVNQYSLAFSDRPTRLKSSAPVSWSAQLEIVCQSSWNGTNYTSLGSISYGFNIAANGTVTATQPTGSSDIVIDTFSVYDNGVAGGVTIRAHYIGCCSGFLQWVQTITTSHPLGGCAGPNQPYNDPCPPDDNLPYYWTNSEWTNNISNYP